MALRIGTAAANWAKSQTSGYTGMCLKFVRLCFNAPSRYPSARSAWLNAKYRHTAGTPPLAVPVFWNYLPNGHIAFSLGGGYIRSTDWPSRNRIGTTTITRLSSAWGKRYSGWSEDLNGYRVYAVSTRPAVSLSAVTRAARNNAYGAGVLTVQKALKRRYPGFDYSTAPGTWGPRTREYYAAWQRTLGYSGSDANGIPGQASLSRLGSLYGFRVVA